MFRYSLKSINARITVSMYRQIAVCLMWVWIAHFDRISGHTLTEEEAEELTEYADLRQAREAGGLMYNEQVRCDLYLLD